MNAPRRVASEIYAFYGMRCGVSGRWIGEAATRFLSSHCLDEGLLADFHLHGQTFGIGEEVRHGILLAMGGKNRKIP